MPILAAEASDAGWFPPAHDVFKPLIADPRELQFAVRLVMPVGHKNKGEAAVGDYFGVYRVNMSGTDNLFQVSVGGGAFGRFDLSSQSNELLVADYNANLPFDFRFTQWSFRFMPYHTSSHLGDDYLNKTGGTTSKHTWDHLKWLGSYDWTSMLRLYGGYTFVFRTLPKDDRSALQGGTELTSRWSSKYHCRSYWANDLQVWQRTEWAPTYSSQAGITFSKSAQERRGMSVFVEFMTGPQPYGQFYENKETRWNLGVRFHLT
jgi:hypothetical protein